MVGKILADHSWRSPRGQQEAHPSFDAEEAQEKHVVDFKLPALLQQGLNGRIVQHIKKNHTTQKRHQAQDRVSGKKTRLEKGGQAVARQHGEARPPWRELASISLVGAFIDCHWRSLASAVVEAAPRSTPG